MKLSPRHSITLFIAVCYVGIGSVAAATYSLSPSDDWYSVLNGSGLSPGDEVVLSAGTYLTGDNQTLSFEHQGSRANPITIRAEEGADVIFTRNTSGDPFDPYDRQHNVINVSGAEYLTIRGLEVTGGNWGIRIGSLRDGNTQQNLQGNKIRDAKYVTIESCYIHHTGNSALGANYPGDFYDSMVFRNNEIAYTASTGEGIVVGSPRKMDGSTYGRFYRGRIEGNYIHHTDDTWQGEGIDVLDGSWGNVIANNVLHDTKNSAIALVGTDGLDRNIVEGNIAWNSDHGLVVTSDALIRNNIFHVGWEALLASDDLDTLTGNLEILNNTLVGTEVIPGGKDVLSISAGALAGPVVIANNALYGDGGSRALVVPNDPLVTLSGNVGESISTSPSALPPSEYDASGEGTVDFLDPAGLNFFPTASSALLESADAAYQPYLDFNGHVRGDDLTVGAYAFSPNGNHGWTPGEEFKPYADPGDADRDGNVGPEDLAVLGLRWCPACVDKTWEDGDFDGDGAVGPEDLAILGLHWAPAAAVPEPMSACLLLIGGTLWAIRGSGTTGKLHKKSICVLHDSDK